MTMVQRVDVDVYAASVAGTTVVFTSVFKKEDSATQVKPMPGGAGKATRKSLLLGDFSAVPLTLFIKHTKTSEPSMSDYVRIRACPNPNNFFDEIIPDDGINVADWRFIIRRIPMPVGDQSEGHTFVDSAWLYAESDYDEAQLARFPQDKRPLFMQIVQALAGIRRMHLSGGVEFTMFFEEFVKDGVSRNIEPFKIDIGISILSVRATDNTGAFFFDTQAEAAERARHALQDAKNELQVTANAVAKHLDDDFFRRAWESFSLALGKDEHAINHLFDIRDAAVEKFGGGEAARKALGIHNKEWSDFGRIFNDGAVIGGRHNGKHPAPLNPMTHDQRTQATRFAKNLLLSYGRYLDNYVAAASE